MLEHFLDEVTKIDYWAERNPRASDYMENGITRIDFVHLPLVPSPIHSKRDRLIIARAAALNDAGVRIIEANLYDQLKDIHGNKIVIGGSLEEECVLARAIFLQQQGAGRVIIDLALTTSRDQSPFPRFDNLMR